MKLFIIGKLEGYITAAAKIARDKGAHITHAETGDQALDALRNGRSCDLLMIDVKCDISEIIQSLKSERFNIPVVACGVGTDASAAVSAIKAGAKEYIPLPPDADLIAAILEAVSEESYQIISRDQNFLNVLKMAEQIAPSDASILITGESGTGKEIMAKYIHEKSKRADKPFVSINCAAIPDNLLESELFGHEKGAFTGAIAKRIGKFEEANGGTLLLDEISEMHPSLQAKLLRAIQEKEIDRVGGSKPIKVNIRILATSNRNLEEEVRKGQFREDLFFRLNVVSLKIPPLRNRQKDIEALTDYFIERYSKANGYDTKSMSSDALDILKSHDWPGNIRELENSIHRAVLLSTGQKIEKDAIMLTSSFSDKQETVNESNEIRIPAKTIELDGEEISLVGKTVADVEKKLIINTVKHCLGNRTHAATILGISIRTLRNKLKQYNATL